MNQIRVKGNVGRDPEIRTTRTGLLLANFSVADSRKKPNTDGRNRDDWVSQWWNVTAFKNVAEAVQQQLHKGDYIEVIGTLRQEQYQAKDGSQRTAYRIIANEVALPMRPIRDNSGFSSMGGPVEDSDAEIPF